jgi:Pathogenicity locus
VIRKVYKRTSHARDDELSQLRNIGKAMRADFELLGIGSVQELAHCEADELYQRIHDLTHMRHDPCVWDTYAAAIHQAKTGEALAWWEFSQVHRQRQAHEPFASAQIPFPGSPTGISFGHGRGLGRG